MKKKIIILSILLLAVFITQGVLAAESIFPIEVKAWGGANSWPVGIVMADEIMRGIGEDMKLETTGFSFGADLLLLNPKGFQLGLGFAYLPVFSLAMTEYYDPGDWLKVKTIHALVPLTVDVVFNSKNYYTNLGIGVGWLKAWPEISYRTFSPEVEAEIKSFEDSIENFDIGTVFLIKAGSGWNIPVWKNLAIDFGGKIYVPFSANFSEIDDNTPSPLLALIFSQFNVHVGLSYYF